PGSHTGTESKSNKVIMLIIPRLLSRSSISHTIRMYDMPTMRIRRDWPGEYRLGRLAMDLASSVSVPLSAVPTEISRLVLESLMRIRNHGPMASDIVPTAETPGLGICPTGPEPSEAHYRDGY